MAQGISGSELRLGGKTFIAAAGASCVANASWWMQPLMMHQLIDLEQLGEFSAGLVLSVEMAVMAAVSILSARLLVGYRLANLALVGVLLAIVGGALSIWSEAYIGILAGRALAGAGAGLALMMMNASASLFPDPDKAFARLSVVSILFGMAIVAALPLLAGAGGTISPFLLVVLSLVFVAPLLPLLPQHLTVQASNASHEGGQPVATGAGTRIALLAGITFAIGCASGVMWAFYAVIGQKAGMSMHAVDGAISAAILVALVGAAIASFVGGRLGRTIPVAAGLIVLAGSVAVLSGNPTEFGFRLATMGNVGALYFLTPYLFGAAAAQDVSGRGAVYVGSAFYLTGAVGPAVGGYLAETIGMDVVGTACFVIAVVAFLAIWWVERSTPVHGPDLSHEGPVMALHGTE